MKKRAQESPKKRLRCRRKCKKRSGEVLRRLRVPLGASKAKKNDLVEATKSEEKAGNLRSCWIRTTREDESREIKARRTAEGANWDESLGVRGGWRQPTMAAQHFRLRYKSVPAHTSQPADK
jgi:hypothetical protein